MNRQKQKLSYKEQIAHLKEKGIHFNIISEEEALHYLKYNTYLFKLSSYRKNYPKDMTGSKYLHLDFATLVDLAVIDMYLRSLVLKLSLNIEHFAKVNLMRKITTDSEEDGYSIVEDYFNTLSDRESSYIKMELERNAKSPYCKQAYQKYKQRLPVWVFIEIISFGSFLSFYKFCAERFRSRAGAHDKKLRKMCNDMTNDFYLMLSVKRIRNAAAHNNCIINDLRTQPSKKAVSFELVRALRNDLGFGQESIQKKISNIRIAQILTCLYMHKKLVSSPTINSHLSEELHNFVSRLFAKSKYDNNLLIKSTFDVLSAVVDKWYPIV